MDLHRMLMQISLIGVIISTTVATTAAEAAQAKPGCDYMCGDVKIPFPFGLTDGCYLNKNFHITCEDKVTAKTGDFAVKRISIEDHELRVLNFVARRCYNKTGGLVEGIKTSVKLGGYTISSTKNKFTVVGCDTYAYLIIQLKYVMICTNFIILINHHFKKLNMLSSGRKKYIYLVYG